MTAKLKVSMFLVCIRQKIMSEEEDGDTMEIGNNVNGIGQTLSNRGGCHVL